jgi:hypothetical protein
MRLANRFPALLKRRATITLGVSLLAGLAIGGASATAHASASSSKPDCAFTIGALPVKPGAAPKAGVIKIKPLLPLDSGKSGPASKAIALPADPGTHVVIEFKNATAARSGLLVNAKGTVATDRAGCAVAVRTK